MTTLVGGVLVGLPAGLFLYAYAGYPLLLGLVARLRGRDPLAEHDPPEWPLISVSLPAHNEEDTIRGALEALLAADYPEDRRQIVVVSDASEDRTDEIVREFQDRGVELVRLDERGGKTAAENAAVPHLRGEIVVNTDASVRVLPDSLKALVRQFSDPGIGVASGRDRSVEGDASEGGADTGEAGYVGYEMWVRALETRAGGIVGASGCYYAIRRELHEKPVPGHLSRDFAAALTAREEGFRSVSVDEAECLVPRTGALANELNRKVRTMARGLATLLHRSHLLNPLRYGLFAWKLFSHKLCRWLAAASLPLLLPGLALLSLQSTAALAALLVVALVAAVGGRVLLGPDRDRSPPVAACGYVVAATAAALKAWATALRGRRMATWRPTRR